MFSKTKEQKDPKTLQQRWSEMRAIKDGAYVYTGSYNDSHDSHRLDQSLFWNEFNIFLKWNRIMEFLLRTNHLEIDSYNILDAGCGNGYDLRKFIEIGAKPDKCYGFDFNEKSISYAKEMSSTKMNFSQGSLTKLPFAEDFFDIILSFQVINNYLEDNEIIQMSSELRRVIKPTGLLFLICPLSEDSAKSSGLRNMPTRNFRQEEIQTLFPDFEISIIRYCNLNNNSNSVGSFTVNIKGEPLKVDLDIFNKIANGWLEQNIYDSLYVQGAMNYLLTSLDIQKNGQSMILLKPKP